MTLRLACGAVRALAVDVSVILALVAAAPAVVGGPSTCDPSPTPAEPWVIAAIQVWHGSPSHSQAFSGAWWLPDSRAYDSRDPIVIADQIATAKAMGIDAFLINWFGSPAGVMNDSDRAFMDEATSALFDAAVATGDFCLLLLYDEGTLRLSGLDPTQYQALAESDLAYADAVYLDSPAYLKLAGKPALLIFSFPEVHPHLVWSDLRPAMSHDVTLLNKDPNPDDPVHDASFDGFFGWIWPGSSGWHPFGQVYGADYLHWFYQTMRSGGYSNKVSVGAVWSGFDDSLAPWGSHRFISRSGGEVYDQTWRLTTEYEQAIVLIATFNDFEEGSDIQYGIEMKVDMEEPMPEILMRSSPIEVTWTDGVSGVLQVYHEGLVIYEETHSPPVEISLESGAAYELKLWLGSPDPLAKTVKIRRQDPDPTLVFYDGFESGDTSRWTLSNLSR